MPAPHALWAVPVRDLRPRVTAERHRLTALLDGLSQEQWLAPTAAGAWTVKDIALHLLDDDLRWLSHQRDADPSGLVDMSDRERFVDLLAAGNQRWVDGARPLSRRLVSDLLAYTGRQVDEHLATSDLRGQGHVSWAADGPVPFWFQVAQEFTERWVHQQQIRGALDQVADHEAELPDVLRTFVWAFPHQYRAQAPAGTRVGLELAGAGVWTLTADGTGRWDLGAGADGRPAAVLRLSETAAWRLLTGASVPAGGVSAGGPTALVQPLLRVRGIIVQPGP